MNFVEKFERLCVRAHKSPSAVSRELGISNGAYSNWKRGTMPYSTTLRKIADYFGVPIEYFYKDEEADDQAIESAKVAVFGVDVEVTDEEWDEIRQYAQFIKQRKAAKKEGNQTK